MNIQFDRVIHSGMVRAVESATIISEQLNEKFPLIEDKNLTEGIPVAPIPYAGISQRDVDVSKIQIHVFSSPLLLLFSPLVIDDESMEHLPHISIEHAMHNAKTHMISLYFMLIYYVTLFASRNTRKKFMLVNFHLISIQSNAVSGGSMAPNHTQPWFYYSNNNFK
jgi:hypothetical protein